MRTASSAGRSAYYVAYELTLEAQEAARKARKGVAPDTKYLFEETTIFKEVTNES
jgi:hypothetical protein